MILGARHPIRLWIVCGCFLIRTAELSGGHRAELLIIWALAETFAKRQPKSFQAVFSGPRWPLVPDFSMELKDISESV